MQMLVTIRLPIFFFIINQPFTKLTHYIDGVSNPAITRLMRSFVSPLDNISVWYCLDMFLFQELQVQHRK